MEYIDCKSIAQKWKDEIKAKGIHPSLRVIQVGHDPASDSYIRGKMKDCKEVGFICQTVNIKDRDEDYVLGHLLSCLKEKTAHGTIVQLPLPFGIEPNDFLHCMNRSEDVDGFKNDSRFKPCTPEAIMELLKELNVDLERKSCVVIGRSEIVGRPMAKMLLDANATVTVCHSKSSLVSMMVAVKFADVVVVAAGRPNLIPSTWFKEGAVVIDVGINRTSQGLVGDVVICSNQDFRITPVPGGVGLLTRAMLMRHVAQAYEYQTGWGKKNE